MRLVRVQTIATHDNSCAFREVHEAFFHAAAHLLLRHEFIGRNDRVSANTSWSASPSSVIGCCNCASGWTVIRRSSTSWGVQPRAALSSCACGARPWFAHSLVAECAACSYARSRDSAADCTVLLADGAADGLTNPPVRIGDKAQSTPRLELVHRAHQPQIPLLN